MAEPSKPSEARQEALRALAQAVGSVAEARRVIAELGLETTPLVRSDHSVFYFGQGVRGARELAEGGPGFCRIEQTEAGYFLDQVTRSLQVRGLIPRGQPENLALFGDRGAEPPTFGLWGELSAEFAAAARGVALLFADLAFSPGRLRQTLTVAVELPVLNANAAVGQVVVFEFRHDTREFFAVVPSFVREPAAYGLGEALLVKIARPGGEPGQQGQGAQGRGLDGEEMARRWAAPSASSPRREPAATAAAGHPPAAPTSSPAMTGLDPEDHSPPSGMEAGRSVPPPPMVASAPAAAIEEGEKPSRRRGWGR